MVTVVQGKVCAKNHPHRLSRLATDRRTDRRTDRQTDFLWHRPDLTVGQKVKVISAKMPKLFFGGNSAGYGLIYFKYTDHNVYVSGAGMLAVPRTADFLVLLKKSHPHES